MSENIRIVMYELKSGNDALSLRKLKEKKINTQMNKKKNSNRHSSNKTKEIKEMFNEN